MDNDGQARRVAVFEDTAQCCRKNKTLRDAVAQTLTDTRLFLPNDHPGMGENPGFSTKVTVSEARSLSAAEALLCTYPGSRVAVLNFASATHPGGGVANGSSAQEESLCRASTLYPCLDTQWLSHDFYQMHRARHNPLYTDACIWSPGVVVFKTDTAFPEPRPEEEWFRVDVLSCAAPNLRGEAPPADLQRIHERRGRHLLEIAAACGDEIVVLGAFGCGAFQNPPATVAAAYQKMLPEFEGRFREIHFAVFCGRDKTNYQAFAPLSSE